MNLLKKMKNTVLWSVYMERKTPGKVRAPVDWISPYKRIMLKN